MTRLIQPPIMAVYALVAADARHYVGGSVNVRKRWSGHRAALNGGTHANKKLTAAWLTDAAGFTFRILERVADAAALRVAEQWWIDTLGSVEHGLNVAPEAGSVTGLRHTPEARAAISLALRLRETKPETRAKRALAAKGNYNRATLSPSDVAAIKLRLASGESGRAIARSLGVCSATIHRIANGTGWRSQNA